MLRPRPARPLIFLELTRFGVVSSDWKWILILSLLAYLVPMILDLQVWLIPAVVFTCPAALGGGIILSNLLHKNRPPQWLEHQLRAIGIRLYCRAVGRQPAIRAMLPGVDHIPLSYQPRRPKERRPNEEEGYAFTPPVGENVSVSYAPKHIWK